MLRNVLKKNNQYYSFSGFPYIGNTIKDSLYIHDLNLNLLKKIGFNSNYFGSFFSDSQLIVLSKNVSDSNIFYINQYDVEGNIQNQITIQDTINDFAYNDNHLVLVSDSKFYNFFSNFNNYTVNAIGAKNIKIAGNNVILTSAQGAWAYNLSNSTLKTLSNSASQSYISDNNSFYYIISNGILTEYNNLNNDIYWKQLPAYTDIKFKKDHFLFINKQDIENSDRFDVSVVLINPHKNTLSYQSNYSFYDSYYAIDYFLNGSIDFFILPNQNIIINQSTEIVGTDSNGNILWTKPLKARDIVVNSDNSFWVVSAENAVGLIHIQNENNRCTYNIKNPFSPEYCAISNGILHQVTPKLVGDFPVTGSYINSYAYFIYSSNLEKLGLSCEWYKDGQLVDTTFFGYFRGNGNYKIKIKQKDCNVESEEKYVSYSQNIDPFPPTLSIDKPYICQGKSATISGSCSSSNLIKWLDTSLGGSTRVVSPNITSTYFASCGITYNHFIPANDYPQAYFSISGPACVSDNKNITVNVYNTYQTTTLSGQAASGIEYGGGKIVSTQTIPASQKNQYKFIKSVELNTNFFASQGSVLTIEAEQGCNN